MILTDISPILNQYLTSSYLVKLIFNPDLLTFIMGVINMSRPESLLEYQRLVLEEALQFFEPVFTEDKRLLMFHSIPYRKNYMESIF